MNSSTATAHPRGAHLSSETIDLLLLSALSAPEANEAKHHIDSCESCRTRWRELNDDKARFEQFVFARTLPKVEARVAASRGSFFDRFKLKLLIPTLAVAGAAAAVVLTTGPGTQTEDDSYVGMKGFASPSFEVFAMRGAGAAFAVKDDTVLHPSDRIRFVVSPAGAKYLMVASTDGAGVFSVYHPFGAAQSHPVEGKAKVELPGAVELDDTLGAEKIVAVFSDAPITAAQVEAALKLDAKNPKLPGVSFVFREFRKATP
ncbi:MAG: hypothetical protein JNM17_08070 [Archangium sp.]|nr:hypothetical protein [Archangium sp.]